MKKYFIATLLVAFTLVLNAQLAEDALRYSQSFNQGTARSMGAGGAFSAVGADFSVASTNPAGLGLFRSFDMTITPEVFSRKAASTYNGRLTEDFRTIFDLSNLGYVMTSPVRNGMGWKFTQFAIGMNRLNNYNSVTNMQGTNNENTKLDVYWQQADWVPYYDLEYVDPYYLEPAWAAFLLDTVPGYDDFYSIPEPDGGVYQTQITTSKGSTNEWLFAFAANYNDKLFLGATLGLPYIRFDRKTYYSERFNSSNVPDFNSWSVTENLTTTGWGINLKVGAIYKPTDWVRVGASIHTPSYYWNMTDTWNTVTTATFGGFTESYPSLVTGDYSYRFNTPMKAIGSVAFFINQMGWVSAEYEYADYSNARFGFTDNSTSTVNDDIRNSYQSTNNLRFGTEWRLGMIMLRGGYGFSTSPYADNLNDGKRTSYSGGIGYKKDDFAMDFAYVYSMMNEDYYLYDYEGIFTNAVKTKYTAQQFALTFRFNF
jgi:hypothetical protein